MTNLTIGSKYILKLSTNSVIYVYTHRNMINGYIAGDFNVENRNIKYQNEIVPISSIVYIFPIEAFDIGVVK